MKKLFFVLMVLLSLSGYAQQYEYCELQKTGEKEIFVKASDSLYVVKDNTGNPVFDILAAVLIMEKDKWECLTSYATCDQPRSGHVQVIKVGENVGCKEIMNHIILRRKISHNPKE